MADKQTPENKIGKVIVSGMAVIALVVVAAIDVSSPETVSPFVYGGLVGAIVGVDAVKKILK